MMLFLTLSKPFGFFVTSRVDSWFTPYKLIRKTDKSKTPGCLIKNSGVSENPFVFNFHWESFFAPYEIKSPILGNVNGSNPPVMW